eukprot:250108_1
MLLFLLSILFRFTKSLVNMSSNGEIWQCIIHPYSTYNIEPLSSNDMDRIEQLEQVQLVMRHGIRLGDESFSDYFPNIDEPMYECDINTITQRTDFNNTDTNHNIKFNKQYVFNEQYLPNSNCEWTQTTIPTINQMNETANMLIDAYIGESNDKISKPISITNISSYFRIASSDFDRSIATTYYLITSLIKKLNITTADSNNISDIVMDILTHDSNSEPLVPLRYTKCVENEQWIKWRNAYLNDPKITSSQKQMSFVNSEYVQDVIRRMKEEGVNKDFAENILSTSYNIQYGYCNGLTLPLSNDTWNDIVNISWHRISQINDYSTDYAKKQHECYYHILAMPILNEINDIIQEMIVSKDLNNNNYPKIVTHIGHHETVQYVLWGLELYDYSPIGMGEFITLEIYSADLENEMNINQNISYLFRWMRKGQVLKYPFCEYSNNETLCDLNILIQNGFNDVMSGSEWAKNICPFMLDDKQCGYNHANSEQTEDGTVFDYDTFWFGIIIGMIIGVSITISFGYMIKRCCLNKKTYYQRERMMSQEMHNYQSTM